MNTQKFIEKLETSLHSIPKQEAKERISFYLEMIDDRIEEGLSEEEAIAKIGPIEDIAKQIISEYSAKEAAFGTAKKRKLSISETVLLVIGSPVWLPIMLAALIIVASFYLVLWSLIAVIWAVELPLLIFEFLSKYLFKLCKKLTKCTALFTKYGYNRILNIFKKGSKTK